jgi:hypothetical protein
VSKAQQPYRDTKLTWLESQGHVTALLAKYGITETRFTNYGGRAYIEFLLPKERWPVRLSIPVNLQDQKEANARWRALYWYLKSKMEAAQFGLVDLKTEWLPFIVIGDRTVAEGLLPELERRGLKGDAFRSLLQQGVDNVPEQD